MLHFDVKQAALSKVNPRDTKWHTWTNVLGFPVMGIWPDYSDGTDINAVDRSPDGRYLVTADDFGKVCCNDCVFKIERTVFEILRSCKCYNYT